MVYAKGNVGDDDSSDGAVSVYDFKGNPADRSKTGGWLGAGLILGTELSERVCVMGISMNLVTYLVGDMHLSNSASANIVTNFMGTLNLLALFGGFLADAKLGRPQGSPMTVIWRVVSLAWSKRKLAYPIDDRELNEYDSSRVAHTQQYRCLDKAAIIPASASVSDPDDTAGKIPVTKTAATVNQVEEVKMIIKLLPIWSTCILFWTVYSQMTTFSVEQATYMNRDVGSFVFPSGSLSVFLFLTILLTTSLNERLLIPFARKFTHNVQGMTSLQRVAIGLVFGMLAMAASAVVENKRRRLLVERGVKISCFWLVPQYFLVGTGEAFAYVGQLEFFIREAPERMKSMSTGLFLTTLALGFFLSSVLVSLVDEATDGGWIRNNLNKGRLDYFYWMLAVLGVINFILFLYFASRHEYKAQNLDWKNDQVEASSESKGQRNGDDGVKQVIDEVQEFV
ncbi:protein NRT1/ PTR FAMILY 6.4 [Asparagus officinalis]|uniref:protein NRT1/ PTR FAMILY 6.4 n=1 Tax=Asparagus officinalis TaxID=4686 RepID=UPI00098DF05E|nr:protein NRT1/ PTR FAMILY 6.4 [Asparagus officinalis]